MPTMAWPRERKTARVTTRGRESDPQRGWKSITELDRERGKETDRVRRAERERDGRRGRGKREYQEAEAAA